jgi:glycosyltransferase involved in cell wall biosynthesis
VDFGAIAFGGELVRIAILTDLYLPHMGGQEFRYAELGQALMMAGHHVDIYAIGHSPELQRDEVKDGIRVRRFPITNNLKKPLIPALKRKQGAMWLFALWTRYKVGRGNYDLVLFNQWPLSHILLASRKVRQKALIDWCELRDGRVFSFIQKWFPHLAAANIAVSTPVAQRLAKICGRPVDCIPSGIWPESYRRQPRETRKGLIFIGRLTPHKNVPLLIKAYDVMRDKGYQGPLTIVGGGPSMAELKSLAEESRYRDGIRFSSVVDEDEKRNLLAGAELMVIPSRREGFPRVVAEAMASGLPVVTAKYSENGTCDVVNQFRIGLVADTNAIALADTALEVFRDWNVWSENGLAAAQELHWSKLVLSLEQLTQARFGIKATDAGARLITESAGD